MEPSATKKLKLDTICLNQPTSSATEDIQPVPYSVRQQLRDLLSAASTQCCGIPLPIEISDQIIGYCLYRDLSELPADAFEKEEYQVLGGLDDIQNLDKDDAISDSVRENQLRTIMDLPGKPLEVYGKEVEDILDDADLAVWWIHVGFPVGWKGSGELLEFDLWMCCEFHHYHGVFVFEKGSTDVLLRDDPTEFCQPVKHPNRAQELSDLCGSILWKVTE